MKYLFAFLFFLCVSFKSYAQLLYLQENYKGGMSVDGKSYYGENYLSPDTINFVNSVPASSIIKKAFLVSDRYFFNILNTNPKDNPVNFLFNNNTITIDSTNIVSDFRCTNSGAANVQHLVVKDVTPYTLFNGNQLITPCQSCSVSTNPNFNYVYDGFLLVILYENSAMSTINAVVYLNNQNLTTNMLFTLNNFNSINTTKDVGLSCWANDLNIEYPINFILNSSLGNFNLGDLWFNESYLTHTDELLAPGSFYYQNNTLFGLRDDSPDGLIDSTDALVNIKTYISNNTTNFNLSANLGTDPSCYDVVNTLILAYSSPCPARGIKDTTYSYAICSGITQTLAVNGNTANSNYSWFAADGSLTTATTASVAVTPTITTNYIAYIDSAGCKHTERFTVNIAQNPKFDSLYVNNAICGSALGSLTVAPAYGGTGIPYNYNVNAGVQINTTTFVNIPVGTHTAAVTDTRGCSYTKSFTIILTNPVAASFSVNPNPVCINEPVQLINASTGGNLQWWDFGTTLIDTSNIQSPTYVYSDTGTYNITLITYNNLRVCSDTIIKTIIVKDCPPDSINIIVPNIFSPNADDINEAWQLIVYNVNYTISNYQCTMYDRWGIKVFETNNINQAWDGRTTSGLACSAGAYYYVIKFTAANSKGLSEQKDLRGYLELVR